MTLTEQSKQQVPHEFGTAHLVVRKILRRHARAAAAKVRAFAPSRRVVRSNGVACRLILMPRHLCLDCYIDDTMPISDIVFLDSTAHAARTIPTQLRIDSALLALSVRQRLSRSP